MESKDNEYLEKYWEICESAKDRTLPKDVYVERHHIYPLSIYGENNNLVILTAQEHFLAHKFLWLGLKEKYGTSNKQTRSMAIAFRFMSRQKEMTEEDYALYRVACVDANTGKNNHMYGTNMFEIWAKKYGEDVAKQMKIEHYRKRKENYKNPPLSEETKEKIRKTKTGNCACSEETKEKLKTVHRNRTKQQYVEIGRKIYQSRLKNNTLKLTEEAKEKIRKTKARNKNPRCGISIYSIWLEKYGKEEADLRLKKQKEKSKETKLRNKINKEKQKNETENNPI